jgi:integrase
MPIYLRCPWCKSDFKYVSGVKNCQVEGCKKSLAGSRIRYNVKVMKDGRRVSRTCDTVEEAKQVEADLRGKLKQGGDTKKKLVPTISTVWIRYIAKYQARGGKAWRQEKNRYDTHIGPRFGPCRLCDIKTESIESFLVDLSKRTNRNGKPLAARTIRHVLELMQRIYIQADEMDLYSGRSPIRAGVLPKVDNEIVRMLTGDQMARLLAVLDEWPEKTEANLIRLLFFIGARFGEMAKLEWDDVDFLNRTVTLKTPKGGKTVRLPLNQSAIDTLERQRALGIQNRLVFPSVTGIVRGNLHKIWRPIARAAGIPDEFRGHDARHHFASALASSGRVTLHEIQKLLGHHLIATTQKYSHLMPGILARASGVMDSIVEQVTAPDPPGGKVTLLDERRRGRA